MLNDTTKNDILNQNLVTTGNGHPKNVKPIPDPEVALASLKEQIANLEKQLSLARGTQDIREPEPRVNLATKIEQILRAEVCTTDELARRVGEPTIKVTEKIKELRRNLADVGTAERAEWVWKIGDQATAKELKNLVAKLIEGRRMTTAQLTKITGARMSRVNGVLVELQRDENVPIFNLGSKYRYEWLIMPKDAKSAHLPKKAPKK